MALHAKKAIDLDRISWIYTQNCESSYKAVIIFTALFIIINPEMETQKDHVPGYRYTTLRLRNVSVIELDAVDESYSDSSGMDIQGSQRIYCDDFSDPVTFHLVPPWGW